MTGRRPAPQTVRVIAPSAMPRSPGVAPATQCTGMPACIPVSPPGAKRFTQAWYEHRQGCACASTATQHHQVVLGLLSEWAATGQLAGDAVKRSMTAARQQAGLPESASPGEALFMLATGDAHARSLLAGHLVDHGAPALLELLALDQPSRGLVASSMLAPLAQTFAEHPDSSVWWLLSEVVPLLTPQELYRDVPVGLLLSPRAMPMSPCVLSEVFTMLQGALTTRDKHAADDMLVTTVTGLMGEWEGSFDELVAAAIAL